MKIIALTFLFVLFSSSLTEDLYTIKSNVTPLTSLNFDKQITSQRMRDVNVVLMYKEVDAKVIAIARKYEDFANEYKRVFRIFYINCGTQMQLCDKLKPTKYPAIRIYPPLPIPAFDLEMGDILEAKTLLDNTASYIPKPKIEILSSSNINGFLEDEPNIPKVLLFSDKKTPSFILKAISHTFFDTMCVGFVQNTEESLVKRFKVTSYPTILLIRRKNEKPILYKGEPKLNDIYDFLNIYSEKFVKGTVKDILKVEGERLLKPWLSEDVPELTRDSADDICFGTGKICVMYLDKNAPDETIKATLKKLKEKYAADNKFAYMWLNAVLEDSFFNIFQLEQKELPKVAFLNLGSFKRALIHQGALTEADLTKTYESIYNADARFTRLRDKTLPELIKREVIPKTDL